MITVHRARWWNNQKGDYEHSPFWFTAEHLAAHSSYEKTPGTAIHIEPTDLDEHGRYSPQRPALRCARAPEERSAPPT